jgi:hypothetical protein
VYLPCPQFHFLKLATAARELRVRDGREDIGGNQMKKLTELSPEEKRILAAGACGIPKHARFYAQGHGGMRYFAYSDRASAEHMFANFGTAEHPIEDLWIAVWLPDYGNDLNAMHEAERIAWMGDLKKLHNDQKAHNEWCAYKAFLDYDIHATASQRLDAFLLAKGLCE